MGSTDKNVQPQSHYTISQTDIRNKTPKSPSDSLSSRGSFIITQKENKGEYGDYWKWDNATYDYDIYAHAFDQTDSSGTPYRYLSNTSLGNNACTNDKQTTHGSTAYSSISNQVSCSSSTLNAGNWYNFSTATAGSDTRLATSSSPINTLNSICPKGWRLPPNSGNKSYNTLIRTTYNISSTTSDTDILLAPLSFVRLGYYIYAYGSSNHRGLAGHYWLSTAYNSTYSHYLYFDSEAFYPQGGHSRDYGLSIRCVSR